MDPQDTSSWRRLPGPGEPPPASTGPQDRDRGIRRVQRLSNWTAAALVAATAVTAGFFARAAHPGTAQSATMTAGAQSRAPSPGQPCITVPVATSGGSGVTTTTRVRTCGPAGTGTRPVVIYVKSGERGDN
jgi:hypothetical protein